MVYGGARRLAFASTAARGDDRRSGLGGPTVKNVLRGAAELGVAPVARAPLETCGGGASAA